MRTRAKLFGTFPSRPSGVVCALLISTLFATSFPALADKAEEATAFPGTLILDLRLRGEFVDQAGLAHDAQALTLRTRFGYESETYSGFQFLVEGENTSALVDDFNDTINGRSSYPIIADPDSTQLNRLQVSYTGLSDTKVSVGRQRVVLGDARYVGNVGFRQNEQTYDAAVLSHTFSNEIAVTYGYINKAITVFGEDSANAELDMNTHALWGTWQTSFGTLTGFGIFADVDDVPLASNQTWGVNWKGSHTNDTGLGLDVFAEYAFQREFGNAPADFDLSLFRSDVTVRKSGFSGGAGVELLEGNGTRGFGTPLATLHKYQGWADAFLTTPVNGIRDTYVKLGWKTKSVKYVEGLSVGVIYHGFENDNGTQDFGEEFDAIATAQVSKRAALEFKYARFNGGPDGPADREKAWVTLSWTF